MLPLTCCSYSLGSAWTSQGKVAWVHLWAIADKWRCLEEAKYFHRWEFSPEDLLYITAGHMEPDFQSLHALFLYMLPLFYHIFSKMENKPKYKTLQSCCSLFIYFGLFHFILPLTPCYYLLSPNEQHRYDYIQFSSTNKKRLLCFTIFSKQLWTPTRNWVWVRLVGVAWGAGGAF